MGVLQSLPEGAAERLAALLQQAKTKAEYQRVQAVWLRAALGLSAPQIAQALGWQTQSVQQLHSDYLRHGEAVLPDKPKGGRHHANLTCQQEQELLAPFLAQAEAGGVLVVAPVQTAYEQAVGRPVRPSVRWSTALCIARDGARSCRARSTRRRAKKCARLLKKVARNRA